MKPKTYSLLNKRRPGEPLPLPLPSLEPAAQEQQAQLQRNIETLQVQLQSLREELIAAREAKLKAEEDARQLVDDARKAAKQIIADAHVHVKAIYHAYDQPGEYIPQPDVPEQLCLSKDEAEAQILQAETTLREALNQCRDRMQAMLYRFRTSLYAVDYTAVCDAYQRLYMFTEHQIASRMDSIHHDEKLSHETSIRLTAELAALQRSLRNRMTRLERGLARMGLCLIVPQPGDPYNPDEHIIDDAHDDGSLQAAIHEMLCPGVMNEQQVLCKAIVTVATTTK